MPHNTRIDAVCPEHRAHGLEVVVLPEDHENDHEDELR